MTNPRGSFSVMRRLILQGGAGSVALAGLGTVWFLPATSLAAADDRYPEAAFKQKDDKEAIKLLYGRIAEPSDKVRVDAPEIAENGAVVPVSVTTTLEGVTSITLVVPENPNPLAAYYRLPPGTMPSVANRLKMAKTSNVIAIVEADGKLYSTAREVKVTIGGCGG
jgi:sulfur-oxidizing protein SoxY